ELIPSFIINENTTWQQSAITVAGGNGPGNKLKQLNQPRGFYIDEDSENIYIADFRNNRIVRWKFGEDTGEIVAGGGDSLSFPRDVIFDKQNESLIICDWFNRRLIRWFLQNNQAIETLISDFPCWCLAMHNDGDLYISDFQEHQIRRLQQGDREVTIVAGGNGQGKKLNQLNGPKYIVVDGNHSVYVADSGNNRVTKWMKDAHEGTLVALGKASGENPNSLMKPIGVVVDHIGNIYVSNEKSHQITRWSPGAIEGVPVVGGKQSGSGPTQLKDPHELFFDRHGNLYVVDTYNHRIQKFLIDAN
ncbi:unnamed protein product, partial [Adineta steineri]